MARKKLEPRSLPLDGLIQGGPLHGWHYLLQRFVATPSVLFLRATCTPPAWPFPRDINLDHFLLGELVEVPEPVLKGKQKKTHQLLQDKQRWMQLESEIELAFNVAQMAPPKPLIWQQQLPLRDLLASINEQLEGATA